MAMENLNKVLEKDSQNSKESDKCYHLYNLTPASFSIWLHSL